MSKKSTLNKLPPKYDIETKKILKQLNQSSRVLAELKAYSELIPNKNILVSSLPLQEAKASSEIENIITTNDTLYKAIVADKSISDSSTKEVINYKEALWTGVELVNKSKLITTNTIIKINQILEGHTGGIRKIPGTTLKNAITGEVVYTPPTGEGLIRELLSNLEEYYNSDDNIDPLIKLAITHYQFEAIHPFHDGNGRTGRILNILYLLKEDLLDSPILYLSSYIIANKERYYELLNKVTTENDWESWILYMLCAIEKTSIKTLDMSKKIKALLDKTIIEVKEKLSKIYSKELVEFIFEEVYTKTKHLEKAGFGTRKTIAKYLNKLVDIGILSKKKVGKEMIYINIKLYRLLT